ncbi:MAG: AEC family transporter [Candidatus Auribacterota bacterium]
MNPFDIFFTTLSLMIQLTLVGLVGFYGLKKGMIKECCLLTFSKIVIEIAFPCYIFTHILKNLVIDDLLSLFWLPLSCVGLLLLGHFAASLYLRFDSGIRERGEFKLLVTFQNAVYIPLPIIASLFKEPELSKVFLYLFIFNIPFSAMMFTVGPHVLRNSEAYHFSWRALFNNPVIAVLISLFLVYTGWHKYIPGPVKGSFEMIGKLTVPLVMIVTGGIILLNSRAEVPASRMTIAKISILKLLVIPLIVLGILLIFKNLPREFGLLFILEAAVPSASTLPLLARREEADYRLIGATVLWSYLASILTVPLFVSLYYYLV